MATPKTISTDFANLPELPDKPEFTPGSTKLVRLGNIIAFQAGWGYPIDNETILNYYATDGHNVEEVEAAIGATGFSRGYYYPLSRQLFSEATQAWHAEIAAIMAETVARERGWDTIDVLVLGSSTTRLPVLHEVQALLKKRGISVGSVKMYLQACNSALAGINDLCRDEAYHGLRAVVVGLESLTGDMSDLEVPTTIRIFGNGGGALAFVPGEDITHITGRSIAEYDVAGVILGPVACPIDSLPAREPAPTWYEVVGEATPPNFAAYNGGVYIQIPPHPEGKLQMNGMATLAYFAKRVSPLAVDVVSRYQRDYQDQYGPLSLALSHQPSRPVIQFINHDLARITLEQAGIEPREARKMVRRGSLDDLKIAAAEVGLKNFEPIQIPWLMEGTGFNNISAGTSLITMVTMIEKGLLNTATNVPVFGFGIGSVIQADVWRFHSA